MMLDRHQQINVVVNNKFKPLSLHWKTFALIGFLSLVLSGMVGYSLYIGLKINQVYAPLIDAARKIQVNATASHLWFEEILSGDDFENMDLVWTALGKAEWYAQAMLEGGSDDGQKIVPLDDQEIRTSIAQVRFHLNDFRTATEQRAAQDNVGPGSLLDQQYDAIFGDFINEAEEITKILNGLIDDKMRKFQATQLILLVSCLLLSVLIALVIRRYEQQRAKNVASLQRVNDALRDEIGERIAANEKMHKLSSALQQAADSVLITGCDGLIEYANPAFERLSGYSKEEVIGRPPSIVKSGNHDAAFYQKLWGTINKGDVFQDIFVNRHKSGAIYYEEMSIAPLKNDNGDIINFISTGKNITDRIQAEEKLHHLAYHDTVTDLPNRALYLERLTQAIVCHKEASKKLAVLFLDLDRFKTINDTLGHDVGDELLQALPDRLHACVRERDTVSRFGGDEFVLLLEDISEGEVSIIANRIITALSKPFSIQDNELFVTTSIGVSLFPEHGDNTNTLIKHADSAMYIAKEQGRNNFQFYLQDMSSQALEKLNLETQLRHALKRNEFQLLYQPQIDFKTNTVVGVEALLRWQHPEFGLVSPGDFIPVLEETGIISQVGEWVMDTACLQLKTWLNQGHDLRMSINLSGRQFYARGFSDFVSSTIVRHELPPENVELEITESVLMQNDHASLSNLNTLHQQGLRLAIDDFGTGYSSLNYLKRFPINTLKIDKTFIHDITSNEEDAAIVTAIITMAHNLNLTVVAEGVETCEQVKILAKTECDLIQGFYYSKPLAEHDITVMLDEQCCRVSNFDC